MDDNVPIIGSRNQLLSHHFKTVGVVTLTFEMVEQFSLSRAPEREHATSNTRHQVTSMSGLHLKKILIPSSAL